MGLLGEGRYLYETCCGRHAFVARLRCCFRLAFLFAVFLIDVVFFVFLFASVFFWLLACSSLMGFLVAFFLLVVKLLMAFLVVIFCFRVVFGAAFVRLALCLFIRLTIEDATAVVLIAVVFELWAFDRFGLFA